MQRAIWPSSTHYRRDLNVIVSSCPWRRLGRVLGRAEPAPRPKLAPCATPIDIDHVPVLGCESFGCRVGLTAGVTVSGAAPDRARQAGILPIASSAVCDRVNTREPDGHLFTVRGQIRRAGCRARSFQSQSLQPAPCPRTSATLARRRLRLRLDPKNLCRRGSDRKRPSVPSRGTASSELRDEPCCLV